MPDIDKIRKDLADTALYHGLSYAAIVGVAAEIEAVEDKRERAALRREFRELHGLTAQVWARVAKRFEPYAQMPAQKIRVMAYCCQLPEHECIDLYNAHFDHLDEPGALGLVLRDVNDALDARRNGHGAKRATLAEQCAELVERWTVKYMTKAERNTVLNGRAEILSKTWNSANDNCARELAALPAVASVLARRAKAEGK